jgi:CDP-diacylglycerol---glycerol-3-phosphate 3-phosphatidyltransferase
MRHENRQSLSPVLLAAPYGIDPWLTSLPFLKPRFQRRLRHFVRHLAGAGVTANQVTIFALCGSLAVGLTLIIGVAHPVLFGLLPLWLSVRMALSTIDGMLAHEHGQKSRLGGFLNEAGDILSDVALYAPFAFIEPFGARWTIAVIVLLVASEAAGLTGPLIGGTRRCDGPFGKSDRAIAFGFLGSWIAAAGTLPTGARYLFPVFAFLLAVTIAMRLCCALAEGAVRPA